MMMFSAPAHYQYLKALLVGVRYICLLEYASTDEGLTFKIDIHLRGLLPKVVSPMNICSPNHDREIDINECAVCISRRPKQLRAHKVITLLSL